MIMSRIIVIITWQPASDTWPCHETLLPGGEERVRNLRQYFPLFASLHDNNQIPSLWVSSRAKIIRVSVGRGTNHPDQMTRSWFMIRVMMTHPRWLKSYHQDILTSSKVGRDDTKIPVPRLRKRESERCNPLVDWFKTRVSRGAKLEMSRGEESWCQGCSMLHSAPKLSSSDTDWGAETLCPVINTNRPLSVSVTSLTPDTEPAVADLLSNGWYLSSFHCL